jgi:hypothetical protein
MLHDRETGTKRSPRAVRAVTDGSAGQNENAQDGFNYCEGECMADTGEGREIKVRTDAKEAEVVAASKKLLQKSVTARDQTLRRRRRDNEKEVLPMSR